MTDVFAGTWVRRGLIHHPVIDDEPDLPEPVYANGVERLLAEIVWTDDTLKAAHAGFKRGLRDLVTVEGHREWDRRRTIQRRAAARGHLSDIDRAWCEQAANRGLLIQWEKANRHTEINPYQRRVESLICASVPNNS